MRMNYNIRFSIKKIISPKTLYVHKTKFSKNGMTVKNWNEFLMGQLN